MVSGNLRKSFAAFPNVAILSYELYILEDDNQSLRISIMISLSSVFLLTTLIYFKDHFRFGPPFFMENYRMIKAVSRPWVITLFLFYDSLVVIHRLLFYGI